MILFWIPCRIRAARACRTDPVTDRAAKMCTKNEKGRVRGTQGGHGTCCSANPRMHTNGDPKVGAQKTPRAGRNRKTNFFIVKFPTHGLLWHRSNDASRTMPAREEGEAAMTVARSAPSSHSWHERDDGAERVILIRDGVWAPAMPLSSFVGARSCS